MKAASIPLQEACNIDHGVNEAFIAFITFFLLLPIEDQNKLNKMIPAKYGRHPWPAQAQRVKIT